MFSQPEEKLWLVVKHYNGVLEQSPGITIDGKKGIKLEKNCVIKMGRVRLRVRDIDYAEDIKPIRPILSSPASSPTKKAATSATKLKGSKGDSKSGGTGNRQDESEGGVIDINEIKLIEEAQSRAAAIAAGRLLDQEEKMAKRE